jgi:hypothetical protein
LLEQFALMMMPFPLLSFLPPYLANDPLGLFLLITFTCLILALSILAILSLIVP